MRDALRLPLVLAMLIVVGCSDVAPTWRMDPANPVIRPGFNGELDAISAASPHVIEVDGRFVMYYWAIGSDKHHRICIAESENNTPTGWRPRGAVLERQPDTDHNCFGPGFPFVLPREDGPWLMYVGTWGKPRAGRPLYNRTCVALSDDRGKTWRYADHNPAIPLDMPYDADGTGSVFVWRDEDSFHMYYTAIAGFTPCPQGIAAGHGDTIPDIGIGYAVSSDGIHWSKPYAHWLITPRRFQMAPYEYICSKPWMIEEAGEYRLWVNTFGMAYRIRSLVSRDRLAWRWVDSGPIGELGVGEAGDWDDVQRSYLCVLRHGKNYHGWFTGNDFGRTGIGHAICAP